MNSAACYGSNESYRRALNVRPNTQLKQRAMLAFAKLHDWGDGAELVGDDALRVSTLVLEADGRTSREYFTAHTMNELRNWAGY